MAIERDLLPRVLTLIAGLAVSGCDLITGSDEPSFHLELSADTLPVFELGSVVAVDAAGNTFPAPVAGWTIAHDQVARLLAIPHAAQQGHYLPRAEIEARQVGVTTVSVEIDGERASAKLVVIEPLVPEAPRTTATYFSRNQRVWVRWGPVHRSRTARVFRREGDAGEWVLLAEGSLGDYNDSILPGVDVTTLRYAVELCNESGCSGRGEAATPDS